MSKGKAIEPLTPRSFISYYGGKSARFGAIIASRLPTHEVYCEPFGGAAGVLFAKRPSQREIYNDLSVGMVNLFRVVRSPELCAELIRQLELTPYARLEWKECLRIYRKKHLYHKLDQVEQARLVYVILGQGFAGTLTDGGWSFGGIKHRTNVVKTFYDSLDKIPLISRRLQTVEIEHDDAVNVCKRWDSPETVFYLDPPYLLSVRSQKNKGRANYEHEMTDEQHQRLLDFCLFAKGKIIISGYMSQLYQEILARAGWRTELFDAWATSAMYTDANGLKGRPIELTKRTEVLWFSPNCAEKQLQLWGGYLEKVSEV